MCLFTLKANNLCFQENANLFPEKSGQAVMLFNICNMIYAISYQTLSRFFGGLNQYILKYYQPWITLLIF